MSAIFVGTSGFSFDEWKGTFYPEDLPSKKMLEYYSERLDTVEVNYTFRRMPNESMLEGWRDRVPEGFRFSLKAPQRITHFKRLADVGDDVEEFVRRVRLLKDKLGVVLFQLPPNFPYDRDRFDAFLNLLPPIAPYAMEFRHSSWTSPEVDELLDKHGVARCGADTVEEPLNAVPGGGSIAYLRLRKQGYADSELENWAEMAAKASSDGRDVFCYFKHEEGGTGPRYARTVAERARG